MSLAPLVSSRSSTLLVDRLRTAPPISHNTKTSTSEIYEGNALSLSNSSLPSPTTLNNDKCREVFTYYSWLGVFVFSLLRRLAGGGHGVNVSTRPEQQTTTSSRRGRPSPLLFAHASSVLGNGSWRSFRRFLRWCAL